MTRNQRIAIGLLLGLNVMLLVAMAALYLQPDAATESASESGGATQASTYESGTLLINRGARKATEQLSGDVTSATQGQAFVTTPARARSLDASVRLNAADDTLTVRLPQAARRPTGVQWSAQPVLTSDAQDVSRQTAAALQVAVASGILVLIGVAGFFFGYLFSPRSTDAEGSGEEVGERSRRAYNTYVRATSLLLLAGLGVGAVALTISAPRSDTSALFALLGTVAGYIAGSRSADFEEATRSRRRSKRRKGLPKPPG